MRTSDQTSGRRAARLGALALLVLASLGLTGCAGLPGLSSLASSVPALSSLAKAPSLLGGLGGLGGGGGTTRNPVPIRRASGPGRLASLNPGAAGKSTAAVQRTAPKAVLVNGSGNDGQVFRAVETADKETPKFEKTLHSGPALGGGGGAPLQDA